MTSTKADDLEGRIANGSVKLATIGLGYVGLPLSVEFASSGVDVLGVVEGAALVIDTRNATKYLASTEGDGREASLRKIQKL
jgi:UDP-N-acetyl-D-mannosaminuronate dehydrogenase